ncbi:hypothetical protein AB836_01430 [Rickettsiales bacterium (ex Bugula neritina AB1)]|nr:hypothetical protein AB836_01430 [Rickettsiales bacterium (ex Bugula neritina AB1)]
MLMEIIEKIKNLMNKIDYYTCILIKENNKIISSSNFKTESCENTEIYKVIFRIFHDGKKYISTKIGIEDLENFIINLENSLIYLQNSDYYFVPNSENKNFFLNYQGTNMDESQMFSLMDNIHKEIKKNQVLESSTYICNRNYQKYTFDNRNNYNHEKKSISYLYIDLNIEDDNNQQENYGTNFFPINDSLNLEKEIKEISDVLKKKLNVISIKNNKYDVIFHKYVNNFLDMILEAIDSKNVYNKNTFLLDCVGKKVFSENINIIENPHMNTFSDSYMDDDFITTKKKYLVENGVLKTFIYDSEYAYRLKEQSTGNCFGYDVSITNVYMENGNYTFEELIENTQNGLLVDTILGSGFNFQNGIISVGIKGFFVEDGAIKHPVNGTISGNAKELLKNVLIANDGDLEKKNIRTPSIKVFDMSFSNLNQ